MACGRIANVALPHPVDSTGATRHYESEAQEQAIKGLRDFDTSWVFEEREGDGCIDIRIFLLFLYAKYGIFDVCDPKVILINSKNYTRMCREFTIMFDQRS